MELDSNQPFNEVDNELEQLLADKKARIKVIGTGGGGNNTINRITTEGLLTHETHLTTCY